MCLIKKNFWRALRSAAARRRRTLLRGFRAEQHEPFAYLKHTENKQS